MSKHSQKVKAKRKTIQCDNAIKRTGFKDLIANTELYSLSLQAWQEDSSHLHPSYKVVASRPHLRPEAVLSAMAWAGGSCGGNSVLCL